MGELRRHDDDPLYERLSRLERNFGLLDSKVNTLSLEQKHMSDLFVARLSTIEKSQELAISEVRSLSASITSMASETDKSPAGRTVLKMIEDIRRDDTQHEMESASRDREIKRISEWQERVNGVLLVLKFAGASGVVALVWALLRAVYGDPP